MSSTQYALLRLDGFIVTGQLDRARKALGEMPPLDEGSVHARVLCAIEARLLLYEGKPLEALALVRDAATDRDLERRRQIVRAHCHAALGELELCHEAIRWLHGELGELGLRRLIDPEGPASIHARAWKRRAQGPYRS